MGMSRRERGTLNREFEQPKIHQLPRLGVGLGFGGNILHVLYTYAPNLGLGDGHFGTRQGKGVGPF